MRACARSASKERGDPIPPVAAAIAAEARIPAFDEMVNSSADAMIMGRLFTALIADLGVTVVTSWNLCA
jgi:cell division protein ZapE